MALTTQQARELEEINEEIELLQTRLKISHLAGDNGSSGGITHGYGDNANWYKQLQQLRNRRNILEDLQAGNIPSRANLGITNINYVRNSTPYV